MTLGDDAHTEDFTNSESGRETHEVSLDLESDEPISNAVTEVVSEATRTGPEDLRPLYEVVDPDALDETFAPTGSDDAEATRTGYVAFQYEGCHVRVSANGRVVATPTEDA